MTTAYGRLAAGAANRVAAVLLLAVLSPVLGLCALAVLVGLGRPVLFRQERAGLDGRPFAIVKFRTMRPPGPDGGDEGRITRVGAVLRSTSLDELPSLWNIAVGDMVFVGPRPLPTAYVTRYSARQATRLSVRPGLTGWSQVSGRNALSWDERFEQDVWYVANKSWRLDAAILWRTVAVVLSRRGVAHGGHVTMPEFLPDPGPGAGPARLP